MSLTFKLGMRRFDPASVRFKFRALLNAPKLPPVPRTFGHVHQSVPWGMLANDEVGDCVIAGANHETMCWALGTRRALPSFTGESTVADYSRALVGEGGAPYDPGNSDTDTGLDAERAAAWRRKVGVTDAAGVVHKIKAYALLDTVHELELATYLFGAAGVCLEMPDNAPTLFERGHVWDDLSGRPKPENGHYVSCVGKNSAGNLIVVTWGKLQAVAPAFLQKYMSGGLAYFSTEYLLANGHSPEAYDEQQLAASLAAVSSAS